MKFKCLFILPLLAINFNAFSQSFEKGKIVIEGGAGIAVYNTFFSHTYKLPNGKDTTESSEDLTAASVFPLFVEYGITDRIGLGGGLRYNWYIRDSAQKNGTVVAFDIAVRPTFHLVKTKHIDLFAAGTLGYSHFAWKWSDTYVDYGSLPPITKTETSTLIGSGVQYGLSLESRFYFTKSIGIYLSYSFNGYNYPKLVHTDIPFTDLYPDYKLKLNGSTYGIGIMVKIN